MSVDALSVIAANGCFLIAGAGLTRPLGIWGTPRQLVAGVAVAYMAGLAAVGLTWTLLLLAGVPLRWWTVVATCIAFAALGLRGSRGAPLLLAPGLPARRDERWLLIAVGVLVVVSLVSFVGIHLTQPIASFDGWAKWTLKARAIVVMDGVDARLFSSGAYRPLQPDYPLLFPSIQAIDFRFIGWPNTEAVFLQSALLLAGFVGSLAQLLRGRVSPFALWPALLLIAVSPALGGQVRAVLVDAPLAFFLALAALAAWLYLEEGCARWLVLAAMFTSAAVATKDEGTPYVAGLLLVLGLFAWRRGRPLLPVAAASLAVVATALPWRLWTSAHGIGTALPLGTDLNPVHLAGRAARVGPALASLLARSFDPRLFVIALPLALGAALVALRRPHERALPVFVLLLLALLYGPLVWAYWASPSDLDWALHTSAARVVTTPAVLAMAFLPLLVQALAGARPHRLRPSATLLQQTRRPTQGDGRDEPQNEVPAAGEEHSEGLVQYPGRSPAAAAARDPSGNGRADRAR